MSLESEVVQILQTGPAKRIDFKIGGAAVNPTNLKKVATAITSGLIELKVGKSGENFGAAYSSWKTRQWKQGEQQRMGKITIGDGDEKTRMGKVSIFHESVHALVDIAGYKLMMRQDEAFAYLADAWYMAAVGIKVSNQGNVGALYIAANAILDSKNMLKKTGTVLKWTDCSDLIDAIKKIPEYSL